MSESLENSAAAPSCLEEVWSDLNALAEQVGLQAGSAILKEPAAGSLFLGPGRPLGSMIESFREEILGRIELPSMIEAYHLACSGRTRDLLELDERLGGEAGWSLFAGASQRVGREELNRLKALRDQRMVQRYREAVERGEARGWHTLVYGIVLSVYSLPLRQGLLNYSQQTLYQLLISAGGCLEEAETALLWARIETSLPRLVESLLPASVEFRVVV